MGFSRHCSFTEPRHGGAAHGLAQQRAQHEIMARYTNDMLRELGLCSSRGGREADQWHDRHQASSPDSALCGGAACTGGAGHTAWGLQEEEEEKDGPWSPAAGMASPQLPPEQAPGVDTGGGSGCSPELAQAHGSGGADEYSSRMRLFRLNSDLYASGEGPDGVHPSKCWGTVAPAQGNRPPPAEQQLAGLPLAEQRWWGPPPATLAPSELHGQLAQPVAEAQPVAAAAPLEECAAVQHCVAQAAAAPAHQDSAADLVPPPSLQPSRGSSLLASWGMDLEVRLYT